MYFSYTLYQAGRDMSPREQLEADARAGELASSFARLRRSLRPARHRAADYETGADEAVRCCCVTAAR